MVNQQNQREFLLSLELRRAAMWGIGGCILIACVILCVKPPVQRGLFSQISASLMFVLGAIWLSQFLMSRIKFDANGISKRTLWWWTLWPWEAFEDGRIHQGVNRYSYQFPEQKWWACSIELEVLSRTDAQEIDKLIQCLWKPPKRDPPPETLEVQLKWPDSRKVEFGPNRIVVSKKHNQKEYLWKDISKLTIMRLEHGRQDFREIQFDLNDEEIIFRRLSHRGSEVVNWKGTDWQKIIGFLVNKVPAVHIHDFALTGPSKSIDEIEMRMERLKKEHREFGKVRWSSIALFLPGMTLLAFMAEWPKNLVVIVMSIPLMFAVFWFLDQQNQEREKQLLELEVEGMAFTNHDQQA